METKLQGNESNSHFCISPNNQQIMSLHYICTDNLKTNLIDVSLTGTDNFSFKRSNKKYIYLLFSIFQKTPPENFSPSIVFWKDFVFALKVVYGKLLKYIPIIFCSFLRKIT